MSRRSLASLATAAVFVATAVLGGAGSAAAGTTYSAPLRTAVASLPVAAENNAGYDPVSYTHLTLPTICSV